MTSKATIFQQLPVFCAWRDLAALIPAACPWNCTASLLHHGHFWGHPDARRDIFGVTLTPDRTSSGSAWCWTFITKTQTKQLCSEWFSQTAILSYTILWSMFYNRMQYTTTQTSVWCCADWKHWSVLHAHWNIQQINAVISAWHRLYYTTNTILCSLHMLQYMADQVRWPVLHRLQYNLVVSVGYNVNAVWWSVVRYNVSTIWLSVVRYNVNAIWRSVVRYNVNAIWWSDTMSMQSGGQWSDTMSIQSGALDCTLALRRPFAVDRTLKSNFYLAPQAEQLARQSS